MEFPHIGKNCSYKSCNKLDFLPMKCGACREVFCSDHFAYLKHECPEPNTRDVQVPVCPLCGAPVPGKRGVPPDVAVGAHIDNQCTSDPARERRNKVFTNKCSYKGCKTKEMVPLVCAECSLNFCLRHRHATDHACEGKLAAKRRRAAAGTKLRKKKTSKSKVLSKNRTVGTRKYGTKSRYTIEILNECLEKIKKRVLTQRQASKKYDIPRSTIKNKLEKRHTKEVGRPKILSSLEEDSIVSHALVLAELGIRITIQDVRVIVKKYLDDNNRKESSFKDNTPGWEWGKTFLERHPRIKDIVIPNMSRKKVKVTKKTLEEYFNNLSLEIEGVPPENIFTFHEIGFHDNPDNPELLLRRQFRHPEVMKNSTKPYFSVMFCCNAIGEFIPPFIIYKAKKKWMYWLAGAPPKTKIAANKSGWINLQIFEEWFKKQLLPVVKKKQGKKILIGDNLSSHINIDTLNLLADNDIDFVCLLPNSAHLLQPLDLLYFRSLSNNWRRVLENWWLKKPSKSIDTLPKNVFATLLKKALDLGKHTAAINVKAGFKACGIYPFDPEVVIHKTPYYPKRKPQIQHTVGQSLQRVHGTNDIDSKVKQKKKTKIKEDCSDVEAGYCSEEAEVAVVGVRAGQSPNEAESFSDDSECCNDEAECVSEEAEFCSDEAGLSSDEAEFCSEVEAEFCSDVEGEFSSDEETEFCSDVEAEFCSNEETEFFSDYEETRRNKKQGVEKKKRRLVVSKNAEKPIDADEPVYLTYSHDSSPEPELPIMLPENDFTLMSDTENNDEEPYYIVFVE